jgi:hypothetical protein
MTQLGMGFSAINGGTVTVQAPPTPSTAQREPPLTVANTTIGASGLTFRSISANGG